MGRLWENKKGFTLLELLVTITIAGILVGMAVPSFTTFIRSNRAEVQSSSFINAINYARSEAIKRGRTVILTPLVNGGWQGGWRVWSDENNDGAFSAGTDIELQVYPVFGGEATLTSAAAALTFDRFGRSVGIAVGSSVDFAYRVNASSCKLERDISVNHLGRATVARRICP